MNNVRNTFLHKQLPSYVGFFVLLAALGITIILSSNTFITISRATVGSDPKNIQISNLSDTSFTISYTTDANAVGTISYGTDPSTPNIALDDRDQQASQAAEHQVHFITVKNLTPLTKYYYVIDSGSQKAENNGNPFEITTAPPLVTQPTGQPTLTGTVSLGDGSFPAEGIVSISAPNTQQLAALTQPNGSYQIPLNQLRDSTTSAAASLAPATVLQIQVMTPTQQSTAKVLFSNAGNVPPIVLPQNYDFTLGPSQSASESAQPASGSAFPILETPAPVSSPEISTPTNAETFSDQQPTFQGRALPNTEVDITIQSQQEISVKLQSDSTGTWKFRPPMTLAPGKHTITLKSIDASGIIQTLSRSFTVYASGSQFIEPSISPVDTSPAPTATPSPTLADTPTAAPTATPAATPTVNLTPAPTRGPLPKTGSSAVITGIIAGATAIGIGALLFLFSAI